MDASRPLRRTTPVSPDAPPSSALPLTSAHSTLLMSPRHAWMRVLAVVGMVSLLLSYAAPLATAAAVETPPLALPTLLSPELNFPRFVQPEATRSDAGKEEAPKADASTDSSSAQASKPAAPADAAASGSDSSVQAPVDRAPAAEPGPRAPSERERPPVAETPAAPIERDAYGADSAATAKAPEPLEIVRSDVGATAPRADDPILRGHAQTAVDPLDSVDSAGASTAAPVTGTHAVIARTIRAVQRSVAPAPALEVAPAAESPAA